MLIFNLDIDVIADKWDTEEEKELFLENFADIVHVGKELIFLTPKELYYM